MSLSQQLVVSLTTYADHVELTSTDLDRMQHDLHRRLRRPHRPRGRLLIAAAAALLLIAAVAAGALWLRRPDTSVPAGSGPGTAPPAGVYLLDNGAARKLAVLRDDGTERDLDSVRMLVNPVLPVPVSRWHMDGDKFVFESRNELGQLCRSTAGIDSRPDGRVLYDTATLSGPGCAGQTLPRVTGTRLSPDSEAGRAMTPAADGPASPVTAPIQLDGIWLVEGSGILVGVVENWVDAQYVLDAAGKVDQTPEAQGSVRATADSRVVLTSPGCGDTVLDDANVRGTPQGANTSGAAFGVALTATVTADPCNRLGGRGVVTWIRLL